MEGHLVRLARRARGEPVGFAPTYTGPPPLQPGITDELLADAQPAEQNAFTVEAARALTPTRPQRPEQWVQRDDARPELEPRILDDAPPTLTLPRKGGWKNPAAGAPWITSAPSPSVDGAPVTPTLLPGASVDSQPVDVSQITSQVLEEHPHPDPPPRAGEGDFLVGDEDPHPDPPPRTGKGDFRVAAQATTPMRSVAATGRARGRSRNAFAESAGDEPVRVTIGRIEVRAPAPPPPVLPSAEPPMPPRLSLAEYLLQRDRENGR